MMRARAYLPSDEDECPEGAFRKFWSISWDLGTRRKIPRTSMTTGRPTVVAPSYDDAKQMQSLPASSITMRLLDASNPCIAMPMPEGPSASRCTMHKMQRLGPASRCTMQTMQLPRPVSASASRCGLASCLLLLVGHPRPPGWAPSTAWLGPPDRLPDGVWWCLQRRPDSVERPSTRRSRALDRAVRNS